MLRRLPPRRGNHIPAQRNALGKGRKKMKPEPCKGGTVQRIFSPFRAGVAVVVPAPRALPWADLLRPLRGQVQNTATPKLTRRVGMGTTASRVREFRAIALHWAARVAKPE